MKIAVLATLALFIAPAALAISAPDPCASAPGGTCAGLVPIVPSTQIGAGQMAVFNQALYVITGLITVQSGGIMLVHGTTFDFESATAGIRVEPGGTLSIDGAGVTPVVAQSTFQSNSNTPFTIVADAGSSFSMVDSTILGGEMRVEAVGATISTVDFESTPLTLVGVTTTLVGDTFNGASTGIQIVGGSPTLRGAQFAGTDTCISATDATLTVENSVLRHCAFGIVATRGTTQASSVFMDDRLDPGDIGIQVIGGSAEVGHCDLEDWGTAILVTNGGALDEHDNDYSNNANDVVFA